ncbi:hypothetical protein Clacol_004523 [Clathrus columnatus]|uniref:Uncharacterized protein n=1 Tax=Clathrus columnatus TaxID=1419009 RepID=A0AAV5A9C0_9AGAM|nr:hypothetical protein Clacol_004523 [Clathrus columnatus]
MPTEIDRWERVTVLGRKVYAEVNRTGKAFTIPGILLKLYNKEISRFRAVSPLLSHSVTEDDIRARPEYRTIQGEYGLCYLFRLADAQTQFRAHLELDAVDSSQEFVQTQGLVTPYCRPLTALSGGGLICYVIAIFLYGIATLQVPSNESCCFGEARSISISIPLILTWLLTCSQNIQRSLQPNIDLCAQILSHTNPRLIAEEELSSHIAVTVGAVLITSELSMSRIGPQNQIYTDQLHKHLPCIELCALSDDCPNASVIILDTIRAKC